MHSICFNVHIIGKNECVAIIKYSIKSYHPHGDIIVINELAEKYSELTAIKFNHSIGEMRVN